MQVTTRLATRCVLTLALLSPSACQLLGKPGPSAVAQGRYYSTGNPDYDSFFIELHRLQVELKDAPERTAEPRAALAQTLDTGLDADVIKEALSKKATELGTRQIKFSVQRPASEDKPRSLHVTGSPSGDDAVLQKTLEETLTKVSELETAADGWQKSLAPLPDRAASLESGADTAFASSAPRTLSDVKSNLSDARKILELLLTRAKDAEHANDELLTAITGALGEATAPSGERTNASAAAASPPSSEKKGHKASPPPDKHAKSSKSSHSETPSKAAKPAKSEPPPKAAPAKPAPKPAPPPPKAAEPKVAAKPAEPKPEPKPAPKPAPAERSEVPPPPKPTQGTAKPDFEP